MFILRVYRNYLVRKMVDNNSKAGGRDDWPLNRGIGGNFWYITLTCLENINFLCAE